MYRPLFRRLPLLVSLSLLLGAPAGSAAADDPKKVDSALHLIADPETIFVNFDNDPLAAWVKPIFEVIDTRFANEAKRRTIVFEATLHTDRPAEVRVSGRPALSDAETRAVLKAADPAKSPRTRVVDGTLRIVAKVNGGTPDDSGPLVPDLPTVGDLKLSRFQPLSTPEKIAFLRKWARTEAVPLLATFAQRRDRPENEAVRKLGKLLQAAPGQKSIDVSTLTEKNSDYWRAMMATPAHDPLVAAMQVALFVANGEIRRARRVAMAIAPFDDGKWGASSVLADFRWMDEWLGGEVDERIRKGIALTDQFQFDEAERLYDAVLKDDPKSAWAHHEWFNNRLARGLKAKRPLDEIMADWPKVRAAILDADPLFATMASATGPDEVYDLLLRKESEEVLRNAKKRTLGRVDIRYAEIARDLGQPGFAAMLYWNVLSTIDPRDYDNKNLIEDMLYCLESLGVKDLKANVPGDHAAEFQRIDAERAKQKRESPAIRAFVDPPASKTQKKPDDR